MDMARLVDVVPFEGGDLIATLAGEKQQLDDMTEGISVSTFPSPHPFLDLGPGAQAVEALPQAPAARAPNCTSYQ